jgi:hypothetical protein
MLVKFYAVTVIALGLLASTTNAATSEQTVSTMNAEPTSIAFTLASAQMPAFSCSCHALDSGNPFNEAACNALQVGTTCGRVGNIICIPICQ